MDLEHLLFGDDLLAVAVLAAVLLVDDLARAGALVARLLDLLDHRAHLAERDPDTAAGTGVALADSAFLSALAIALDTDDVAGEGKFGGLALVEVFEGDVYAVDEVFCLAGSLGPRLAAEKASAAKQLAEEVLKVRGEREGG